MIKINKEIPNEKDCIGPKLIRTEPVSLIVTGISDHYEDFIGKKIGLIGENYNYTGTLAEVGQENLKLESGNRYDRYERKVVHFDTWYINKDKIESYGDPDLFWGKK